MPSTELRALLVALLVVIAGCSALPGGGGDSAQQSGPAEQHLALLSTTSNAFNATVTVTDPAGTTVHEQSVSFDGSEPRYVELTTLDEAGNYTITIETDLPAVGGGDMSATRTISVDPGPETTVVHATFDDISFVTGTAKGTSVDVPVKLNWITRHDAEVSYTLYRGQTPVENGTALGSSSGENPKRVGSIENTGVYWIAASTNLTHEPDYAVGVVNESTRHIAINGHFDEGLLISFTTEDDDGGFARTPPTLDAEP